MIVPYSRYPSDVSCFKAFWRPMIDVNFYANSQYISCVGLIDSGADQILMDKELAVLLGIDWQNGLKSVTRGVNGTNIDIYSHEIDVEIKGLHGSRNRVYAAFADLPLPFVLLGQWGFFQNYSLRFRHNIKAFDIEVNKS